MSERKVPEVRFQGFSGEWEKKHLETEVDFYSGLTYSPLNIVESNGTLVLRSSNVKNGEVVTADNVYVNSNVVNCQNVKTGDIIVVVRNGSRGLIGKHGQIKTQMDNTVVGAFMTGVQAKQPDFTNALLDTVQFNREIGKNLGATINQITTGSFKKMSFYFTDDTDEQTQIGTFFQTLDNLIAQNQRKYDKLVNMKKACLDKMFPKDGADTPEVRFRGFSGEWKTDKVEYLLDVCSGQDYKHLSYGDIPVYGTGGYMLSVDKALSYKDDAIGIGRKGTIDKPYILNAPFWTVDTLFYAIPKRQNDLYYLFCEMQKTNWKAKDESTGVPSLSKTTINAVEFSTPECDEQTQIGTFFQTLDNLITLRKTELEKLKNIKKACLDKMFI